jgi:hypothetical protein
VENQVGEDEEDATPRVELEDYSTSYDDQEGKVGEDEEERCNGNHDDDLGFYDRLM